MSNNQSDQVRRQVHRLFNFGAVGTLSDAQLVERFVLRRDEAADAAFEELVIRHGPLVLRVCRSVLQNEHDAEDAFQAVFLVLASRARSIRRTGSIASWLFGVAQRVSTRGRRTALRRRRLDRSVVVAQRSASESSAHDEPESGIVQAEIERLPERLRSPVVLCYLEGLTYGAAAHQLGVSEAAFRGRLARARDRLRHSLTRRGMIVPAALLVAGACGEARAAVPLALIHSTVRIAQGFVAGYAVAALARGVLKAMLLQQVKAAAFLLCLALAASYGVWQTRSSAAQAPVKRSAGSVVPASSPHTEKPAVN